MSISVKLKNLPDKPGVYLMKDKGGAIIYIGKALSLKKRVRSYFSTSRKVVSPRLDRLVSRIADFEYIVTDSELEALILEGNLVKKHQPRYNVLLKDDKKYPSIKITAEAYPRLFLTRNLENDGSRYYGPYTNVKMLRRTLKLMKELFPLRQCKRTILTPDKNKKVRPCLNYHIKQCLAPCAGKINKNEYNVLVKEACLFLEGKMGKLLQGWEREMRGKANKLNFEEAARLRDRIEMVKKVTEKQKITVPGGRDEDYLAFSRDKHMAVVNVFKVREGKGMGQEHFFLKADEDILSPEMLASFIEQYYARASSFPREIVLPDEIEEEELIARWLRVRSQHKVDFSFPCRGRKKELLRMVERNARLKLQVYLLEKQSEIEQGKNEALAELKKVLHLTVSPSRIEAFDISHTGGEEAVGSMVVFENGRARKGEYRRFRIKLVSGVDDYAMIREVVERRYRKVLEEKKGLPDLVLIDGGKGQLRAVESILKKLGLEEVPVISIAKKLEQVFVKGKAQPLTLSRKSFGLRLIQEIRDEAHRFAVEFHRGRRGKKVFVSLLDNIPGVGVKRKQALLVWFGSLEGIRKASVEEIIDATGISKKLALRIQKGIGAQ